MGDVGYLVGVTAMLVILVVLAAMFGLITLCVMAVRTGGASPAASRRAAPSTATGLTNLELCRAWQESFEALRGCESPAARLRIVEARQRYLDELERRDPDGLHAWLESSASPAGSPARFVQDH